MRPPQIVTALLLYVLAAWAGVGRSAELPSRSPREWLSFTQREAGEWRVRWDDPADAPQVIHGRGSAPLPGWTTGHARAVQDLFTRNAGLFGLRAGLDDFAMVQERERRGVHHLRMRQLYRGLPVLDGEYMASVDRQGRLRMLAGGAVRVPETETTPAFPAAHAEELARAAAPATAERARAATELAVRVREGRGALVYVVTLLASARPYWWRVTVDARSGAVLETANLALGEGYTGVGRGWVANPNPDHGLLDTTLVHLRDDVSRLEGRSVRVVSQTTPGVSSPDGQYYFEPCSTTINPYPNPFDEVSAYWHTNEFVETFLAPLGYTLPVAPMTAHVHEPATSMGLAFTTEAGTYFTQAIGLGCCAEDADIIGHESGHYVLVSLGIDGSGLAGKALEPLAMHEGYADFFGAASTNHPCIGDFVFKGHAPVLGIYRCVNTDPTQYNYANYDVIDAECVSGAGQYCKGMIWSGALWDLRQTLPEVADRLVVESLYYLPATPCYAMGSDAIWQADYDHQAGAHLSQIDSVFAHRGIAIVGLSLQVAITGPVKLGLGQPGTYQASVAHATGAVHFAWSQLVWTYGDQGDWYAIPGDTNTIQAACSNSARFLVACTVTDSHGRFGRDSLWVSLDVPPMVLSIAQASLTSAWGGCVRDTVTPSGGLPPYTYLWSSSVSGMLGQFPWQEECHNTVAHTLIVQVMDRMRQTESIRVPVLVPYGRTRVSLRGPGSLCCTTAADTFWASGSVGKPPYQFFWGQQAVGGSYTLAPGGSFLTGPAIRRDSSFFLCVAARDADGVLSDTLSSLVMFCNRDSCHSQMPHPFIMGPSQLCTSSKRDTFYAGARGGKAPYQFSWCEKPVGGSCRWTSSGGTLTGSAARWDSTFLVCLSLRDAHGFVSDTVCQAVSIFSPDSCRAQTPRAFISGPELLCCASTPDTFWAAASGGKPPYQFSWCERVPGGACGPTYSGRFLAGSGARQTSAFYVCLTVRDASGLVSEPVCTLVGICNLDSCHAQPAPPPGADDLRVPTIVSARGQPVPLTVSLADVADVKLGVYDLSGRRLADLGGGSLLAGTNQIAWDCSGARSGVYFVRLSTPRATISRRVVLLR